MRISDSNLLKIRNPQSAIRNYNGATMLFSPNPDLEIRPHRARTLSISAAIHIVLVALVLVKPDLLSSVPKALIRVQGQDYDLSREQVLLIPLTPAPRRVQPPVVDDKPLIQPPVQAAPPLQPPPPPPPPPRPQPDVVIGPEDVIAEGARPDAQPRPSRGDTQEPARAGGGQGQEGPPGAGDSTKQGAPRDTAKQDSPELIARNSSPNPLRDLRDQARTRSEADGFLRSGRAGDRTGTSDGIIGPNFSTAEPTILSDTRGYDFGPYLNQVVNRVRHNWYSLMPPIAQLGQKGRVVIIFRITESGGIQNLHVAAGSGARALDNAAYAAITASNPFGKLPPEFSGDHIDLQFTFLYNMR